MKNIVKEDKMVISVASTNKEAKIIKKFTERKDRRSIELMVLCSIIMDYSLNGNDSEVYNLYTWYNDISDWKLRKPLADIAEDVFLYRNITDDIILIANAILDGKINKAVRLCKKAKLVINLSNLFNIRLFIFAHNRIIDFTLNQYILNYDRSNSIFNFN